MQNVALIASLFGLATAIAWGVSDFLLAKGAKRFSGWPAAFYVNIIAASFYIAIYLLFLHKDTAFTAVGAWYAVGGGVAIGLAGIFFSKGTEFGPVSIVSPLGSIYPLITTMIIVIFFNAVLTFSQIIGVCVVVFGVMVASGLLRHGHHKISIGPLYGLAAALMWGVGYALLSQSVNRLGWELATFIESITLLIVFTFLLGIPKNYQTVRQTIPNGILKNPAIWGAAIIASIGMLTINIGLTGTAAAGAIAVAVSACYPALTIFLSLRTFNEKVGKLALGGAFVTIVGVVILVL